MASETKKISFGFSKLNKKTAVILKPPVQEKKIEFIDCLEGQSIKIKDAVEEVFVPLVIPINDSKKNLLDRIKEAKAKQKETIKKEEIDERPDSELTADELAARELIREAKNRLNDTAPNNQVLSLLPQVQDNKDKEPTLEDYESIPIDQFGLAMLRGMGWNEASSKSATANVPELRPKGLGLGASKLVKAEKQAVDKDGKELQMKAGAYAKIIAGAHKGTYAEVQGMDDDIGRVIVKTSPKCEILTLNEFLLNLVTKDEYNKGSKILNNAKYEEYLNISDEKLKNYKRHEDDPDRKVDERRIKKEEQSRRDRSRRRESSLSDSSSDHNKRKSKKEKSKHRDRSPSSSKKKSSSRHRDRSPSEDNQRKTKKNKKHKSKSRYRKNSSSNSDSDHKKYSKKSSRR